MSCRHGGSTAPGSSTSDEWLYEQRVILNLFKNNIQKARLKTTADFGILRERVRNLMMEELQIECVDDDEEGRQVRVEAVHHAVRETAASD